MRHNRKSNGSTTRIEIDCPNFGERPLQFYENARSNGPWGEGEGMLPLARDNFASTYRGNDRFSRPAVRRTRCTVVVRDTTVPPIHHSSPVSFRVTETCTYLNKCRPRLSLISTGVRRRALAASRLLLLRRKNEEDKNRNAFSAKTT